jgi:hypothetical protein
MFSRVAASAAVAAALVLCSSAPAEALYRQATITASADNHQNLTDQTTLSGCDNCTRWVTLPFTFSYYGANYTQILVSTDGWAAFTDPGGNRTNNVKFDFNGSPGTTSPMIAPFWDDLDAARGGDIRYGSVNGHFTISWSVQHHVGGTRQIWFQLKLFTNSTFEIHYHVTAFGDANYDHGKSATVGYQAGSAFPVAHNLFHNQPNVTAGTAWRFTPYRNPLFLAATDMRGFLRGDVRYNITSSCRLWFDMLTTRDDRWAVFELPATLPQGCSYPQFFSTPELEGTTPGLPEVSKTKLSVQTWTNTGTGVAIMQAYLDRGLTWAQSLAQAPPNTGGKLHWWDSYAPHMFPILVVPGLDPLNEDTPADVLAMLGDLAVALHNDGYEIAIGKPDTGNKSMADMWLNTNEWVDLAKARSPDRRIQLVGISMGGFLVRDYLFMKGAASNSLVRAVHYIDAPLTGANMGSPEKGVQGMVACYKNTTNDYRTLWSIPARQLVTDHTTQCSCPTDKKRASELFCTGNRVDHDGMYDASGWYTPPTSANVARFAYSFGDATGTLTYRAPPAGKGLYEWWHESGFCSGFVSAMWAGTNRDCAPGSDYLKPGMVDTLEASGFDDLFPNDGFFCNKAGVRMHYRPAFINIDSALGFNVPQWNSTYNNNCAPPAGSLPTWLSVAVTTTGPHSAPISYFTNRYANTVNGDHKIMPTSLVTTFRNNINTTAGTP